MIGSADLVLFGHLVGRPDRDIDLERAALLVAETEYPGLDVGAYVTKLDRLAATVRRRLAEARLDVARAQPTRTLAVVLDTLFRELGFAGNVANYYDPRNSFLNQVIDRRTGIPITLALVLMGVGRRVGLPLAGVPFPGHFLVSTTAEAGEAIFVDPFDGTLIELPQLQRLYAETTGDLGEIAQHHLMPAGKRQILARLLNNLRAIYQVRGDEPRVRQMLEWMLLVNPSDETRKLFEDAVGTGVSGAHVSLN